MKKSPPILYTWTDEAPALATHALLPVIRAFAAAADVPVETKDISLAGRTLAAFADRMNGAQKVTDDLAELGKLVTTPEANVIKLPNISASIPQLKACIAELQAKGYPLPDYPDEPESDDDKQIKARYDKVKGSAVNPVLREGNSDRRAPRSVKEFAKRNPSKMKPWPEKSDTHVSTMGKGDFRSNEKSVTLDSATTARIEHVAKDGTTTVLKQGIKLQAGEILDATYMSKKALVAFLKEQVKDAKAKGVLFSVHLKATMMKVSDPIVFGHAVEAYFADVFAAHAATLDRLNVDPDNGLADAFAKIATLPADERAKVEQAFKDAMANGPAIAMVDSAKGITNLHVPSDVIIDASMPPMVRDGGRMWNAKGELQDVKAVIPDSSYAGIYEAVLADVNAHGQLDPATMGTVPNVGLMAQAAEEYGSHDKTFEIASDGTVRIVTEDGRALIEHAVEAGDIWRACQTKDAAVKDWVKLAVTRARLSATPAIFWLDGKRAHDAEVIRKVDAYLPAELTAQGVSRADGGVDAVAASAAAKTVAIAIHSPVDAMRITLERIRKGLDTISVTGNVLRDYLTDLFPILEIGTSARMLSVVPLLNGGGLFETGAGGSAPKHVQQFVQEGHFRWDSLGEYMALGASLEHLSDNFGNPGAKVLADALDAAIATYLDNERTPSAKVGELDNRGSTFYLTLYWTQELAKQTADPTLAQRFAPVAKALGENEAKIIAEIDATQGKPVDVGGYYKPDDAKAKAALCPSATLNAVIAGV
jgi:isocitrate dehydrogenase